MRTFSVSCALTLLLGALPVAAQSTVAPGEGAPNEYIRTLFVNAFYRGSFPRIAGAASGPVRSFGSGLIQEFADSTRSSGKLALIKANTLSDPSDPSGGVYQVQTDMYAYYTSVGTTAAGYPTQDTQACAGASCQYQLFTNKVALFVYPSGTNDEVTITAKDPFYTRWSTLGGISSLGPATHNEQSVTSGVNSANTGTSQTFVNGGLYNITAGPLTGRFLSVRQPVFRLYLANGGPTGTLGFPTGEEVLLPNGNKRQSFEGGSIDYDPAGNPVLRSPVFSVSLRGATSPLQMNAGDVATVQARVVSVDGTELTDRTVTFTTTNSRVVTVQSNGQSVTLRAIGGGTATVSGTAEGKTSAPLVVNVSSTCCGVGEGSPSAAIQQAFQDAITRTRISLRLPGGERVHRAGNGYVQLFSGAEPNTSVRFLLALPDRSGQAYVVTSPLLTRYEELGGPTGSLGYPSADATATGRQLFEGGALAGLPPLVVAAPILSKWAAFGYETGALGLPISGVTSFLSFAGTAAQAQSFRGGTVVASTQGIFVVSGRILTKFNSLNGASGALGVPVGDEVTTGNVRRQEFEGGTASYSDGDAEASVQPKERRPSVSATPAAVSPGTRVRYAAVGFADGATLRISITGQPDFVTKTQTGSYVWDALIPFTATPASIRIRAVDANNSSVTAEAVYTIRSTAEARAQIAKLSGDAQTGSPGALLTQPLRIAVRDVAGNPLAGTPVRFNASPGAEAMPAASLTDGQGIAETRFRLPGTEGIAVLSVEAARQVATFSARSAAASLVDFPRFTQAGADGALLASAASIVRFYQNRNELPAPNGLADVTSLGQFLKSVCVADTRGQQACDGYIVGKSGGAQNVNLWRLGAFAGNRIEVISDPPELPFIQEALGGGVPVLVALTLSLNGQIVGSHFVVAMGVRGDGAVLIQDPDPGFAKATLNEYLAGFSSSDGKSWKATVTGVVHLLPQAPGANSFLVTAINGKAAVASAVGACGYSFDFPDLPAISANRAPGWVRQTSCDGAASEYQVDIEGTSPVEGFLTDLTEGGPRVELSGSSVASFRVTRAGGALAITPQELALKVGGMVNAATFTEELAPGSLLAIFGAGLVRTGTATRVSVGDRVIPIVASTPFQINAAIPTDVAPGRYALRVTNPYGVSESSLEVKRVAPALFQLTPETAAIVNSSGTVNGAATPATRNQAISLYGTGLGAVMSQGAFQLVQDPVTVVINGREIVPAYAGLAPGYLGLYQINVILPTDLTPGLSSTVSLRQAGIQTKAAQIAIQ